MSSRRRSQGPTQVRSWKSIQQKVPRSAGTRRRRRGKDILVWVGAIAFSVGLIFVSFLLLFEPESVFQAGGEAPVEELIFETDGSLGRDWLIARLELPEDPDLNVLDIFDLKSQIDGHPQVKSCIIRKKFPSTLYIEIEERKPVLRLRVRGPDGGPATYFVARDGTVFPGLGRDPSETRRMPFLTGVQLVEVPAGYAPIPGFRTVADLIDTAKSAYPGVYRTWRIVDLSLFDPDPAASFSAIRVRATNVKEIIFGVEDFGAELMNLKDIVDLTRERGMETLERVDLRYDETVPVVAGEQSPR